MTEANPITLDESAITAGVMYLIRCPTDRLSPRPADGVEHLGLVATKAATLPVVSQRDHEQHKKDPAEENDGYGDRE